MNTPFERPGKSRAHTPRTFQNGMTLMEVVIAIGVVAFVVPLILAATGSAGSSRQSAEADTRSAWIARKIQQELIVSWGDHPKKSIFESDKGFPKVGTENTPEVILFDSSGKFLSPGNIGDINGPSLTADAGYVVSFYAEDYNPPNLSNTSNSLSLLRVKVIHPAKASPGSRNTYRYNLITPKTGTL